MYIQKAPEYARPILNKLRTIIHKSENGLEETIKWGAPTFEKDGMVCSFHAFKKHVGFWFHKGVHLKDPAKLLRPGVTAHTMKNIHLESVKDIREKPFQAFVKQAVKLNLMGVKVKPTTKPVRVPKPLKDALARSAKAKKFFDGLAPSHRRAYADWVARAKQAETVERRVKKAVQQLASGTRMDEKYRK